MEQEKTDQVKLEPADIERNKELFAYEMTEVLLMLKGKYAKHSSSDPEFRQFAEQAVPAEKLAVTPVSIPEQKTLQAIVPAASAEQLREIPAVPQVPELSAEAGTAPMPEMAALPEIPAAPVIAVSDSADAQLPPLRLDTTLPEKVQIPAAPVIAVPSLSFDTTLPEKVQIPAGSTAVPQKAAAGVLKVSVPGNAAPEVPDPPEISGLSLSVSVPAVPSEPGITVHDGTDAGFQKPPAGMAMPAPVAVPQMPALQTNLTEAISVSVPTGAVQYAMPAFQAQPFNAPAASVPAAIQTMKNISADTLLSADPAAVLPAVRIPAAATEPAAGIPSEISSAEPALPAVLIPAGAAAAPEVQEPVSDLSGQTFTLPEKTEIRNAAPAVPDAEQLRFTQTLPSVKVPDTALPEIPSIAFDGPSPAQERARRQQEAMDAFQIPDFSELVSVFQTDMKSAPEQGAEPLPGVQPGYSETETLAYRQALAELKSRLGL